MTCKYRFECTDYPLKCFGCAHKNSASESHFEPKRKQIQTPESNWEQRLNEPLKEIKRI